MPSIISIALRGGLDLLHALPPIHDPELAQRRPVNGHTPLGDFGLCTELSGFLEIPCTAYFGVGIVDEPASNSHFLGQRAMGRLVDGSGWLNQYSEGNLTSAINSTNALGYEHANNTAVVSYADTGADVSAIAQGYTGELAGLANRASHAHTELRGAAGVSGEPGLHTYLAIISQWLQDGVDFNTATIDQWGYDTHSDQESRLTSVLTELNSAVTGFAKMHPDVTIVMTSEFGRRIDFNSANGTDHGKGGVMFVIGPNQEGFSIEHKYTTLDNGEGNVPITIDIRSILQNL